MTAANEILNEIAREGREPSKFELGALRAALPGADTDTQDAIRALLDGDMPDKYLAGMRRGRQAASAEYPLVTAHLKEVAS